jgi:hypothetical protein
MNFSLLSARCLTSQAPAILISIVLLLMTARGYADASGSEAASMTTAAALLTQLGAKWSPIRTLKYAVEARDTESEGFRESINEVGHDRDLLITHMTFMVKGADFGWKADTYVPATGTHERVSTGGLANGILSVLFQDQQSVLLVTKNPGYQNAIPVTGCNPLLEAFSFLVSDDWKGLNCPVVKLSSLVSSEAWADAAQRVTSITVEQLGSQPCVKIVFGGQSGNHDIVYFPKDLTGFPLSWQHYEGKYLRRDVSVSASVAKNLATGESIALPVRVKRRDFYDPADSNIFCTSELTLSGLEINQNVDDEDLVIDPSLADSIFDRDNDKRISVPK